MRLDSLNQKIADLPKSRSRILDACEEGTIDKLEMKARLQRLVDRKTQLKIDRTSLQATLGGLRPMS